MALPRFKTSKKIASAPAQQQTISPSAASAATRAKAGMMAQAGKAATSIGNSIAGYQELMEKKALVKKNYEDTVAVKTAKREYNVRKKEGIAEISNRHNGGSHQDYTFEVIDNIDNIQQDILNRDEYSDEVKASLKHTLEYDRFSTTSEAGIYEDKQMLDFGAKEWDATFDSDMDNISNNTDGITQYTSYLRDIPNSALLSEGKRQKNMKNLGNDVAKSTLDAHKFSGNIREMQQFLNGEIGEEGSEVRKIGDKLLGSLSNKEKAQYNKSLESMKKMQKFSAEKHDKEYVSQVLSDARALSSSSNPHIRTKLRGELDAVESLGGSNGRKASILKDSIVFRDQMLGATNIQDILSMDSAEGLDRNTKEGELKYQSRVASKKKFLKEYASDSKETLGAKHPLNKSSWTNEELGSIVATSRTAAGRADTYVNLRKQPQFSKKEDFIAAMDEAGSRKSTLMPYAFAARMTDEDASVFLAGFSEKDNAALNSRFAADKELEPKLKTAVQAASGEFTMTLSRTNAQGATAYNKMVMDYAKNFMLEGLEPEEAAKFAHNKLTSGFETMGLNHSTAIYPKKIFSYSNEGKPTDITDMKGPTYVNNFAKLMEDRDEVHRSKREQIFGDSFPWDKQSWIKKTDDKGKPRTPTKEEVEDGKDRFWSGNTDVKVQFFPGKGGGSWQVMTASYDKIDGAERIVWHPLVGEDGNRFTVAHKDLAAEHTDEAGETLVPHFKKMAIMKERGDFWGIESGSGSERRRRLEEEFKKSGGLL